MLTRIIAAGLMAGVLSGMAISALQHVTTVPLILKAEAYEKAGSGPHGPAAGAHDHSSLHRHGGADLILAHATAESEQVADSNQWTPKDGIERTAYTTLATIGTASGFAIMLIAAMIASGANVTPVQALLWGLGAFFATGLAPSIGLPPELPGSAAVDLVARQTWWIETAAATAGGIWLIFRSGTPSAIAGGIALIAVPHLIGAPGTEQFTSTAPAELAGHFAAASLAVHALMWVLTGALAGYFWQRSAPRETRA